MTSRRLGYTTPARRFGSYAFALTASSTPYPDHFDILFDGFETCDADCEGVRSIEILQDEGGEELVMIDEEVFARDVVLGRRETMYPEYRKTIKDTFVTQPACTRNCGPVPNR